MRFCSKYPEEITLPGDSDFNIAGCVVKITSVRDLERGIDTANAGNKPNLPMTRNMTTFRSE